MARGFESKDVEFQQAEAQRDRARRRSLTADERQAYDRRATLALSLARMRGDLQRATSAAHRRMVEQAIAALEAELAAIPGS
jgi:RNA polymerase-interacting CarD/CdnL/TRCF family regulator